MTSEATKALLAVARSDAPADLVLRNAKLINVFSGQIESCDIAVFGERIAGIGSGYSGKSEIDLRGSYLAPGLIDAHVHIESSLCTPANFASAVLPRGITTVVTDPHEIANVCGGEGIRYMINASSGLPLRGIIMAPSCVPATDMATSGAKLDADDLIKLRNEVHGLAEVMNFPGVINGDEAVAAKLRAFTNRPIDGHAPGVTGKPLNAYIAAGVGSDHECVTVEEAAEKLSRGLYILIREATNARNLRPLLPLITESNSRRICFCTDDRTPIDLLREGSIDHMLRVAIEFGIDPITAIRCGTLNTSEWFGLHDRGAIAPGRLADMIVFDDLKSPRSKMVFSGGKLIENVANNSSPPPASVLNRCKVDFSKISFEVPLQNKRIRVIGLRPDQLVTDHLILHRTEPDVLKMAVIERHHGSGRVGVGFIRGMGLTRGAIAGTVAHDHHNLVVIGCDDASMLTAARAAAKAGGGLAAAVGENVLATLPLPVAGLMSDRPIAEVAAAYEKLLQAARELGSPLHDPFMAMSFMALEVIPSLKLTDKGLVDVDKFKIIDLFE